MKRSLSLEWLLMSLGLLAVVFWLSGPQQLSRANLWLQDLTLPLQRHQPSPNVVLVLADERSLSSIGRWPWRRALHAHLINHISSGQPQSIGLDFLLSEPDLDYPEDDVVLAQSMARSGRVVLPVVRGFGDQPASLPLPMFTQAAARLGHVHLPMDDDGGVRSFYAREGVSDQLWLHLGLSMLCISQPERPACADTNSKQIPSFGTWQRDDRTYIAFAQGRPPFAMYAYIDVLQGRIPAQAFRNKHVLIGTAATGLGTTLPTPSGASQAATYSVELVAHIASGALLNQHAVSASSWANRAFNLVPAALGLAALSVLGPSAALLACMGLGLLTLIASALTPGWAHTVFSPAAALLILTLAYPLWSWRRLNAAARFLNQEMQGLRIQGLQINTQAPHKRGDFLQHRIDAVEQASQQLRQLHQFVTETLLQLPSPTLACNRHGHILLANSAAHRYAHSLGRTLQPQQPLADLLDGAMERGSLQPLWDSSCPPPLDHTIQREGIDLQKNNLLMLSQPFTVADEIGWLVTLVDISDLRQAMAQRDQAMHFISHDIRAPIGAILTVIEMEQHFGSEPVSALLIERIQRYARTGLALADDFVHLARAQNALAQRTPVELGAVIDQALDDTWAAAHARFVKLDWMPQEEEAWVLGDASMLRRACGNLIGNAIKYGPVEGTVFCSLALQDDHWCISVRDEGDGISPQEQARLFAPFTRQHQHAGSTIPGIGLGLAYVHSVTQQHGGSIEVQSEAGQGACFTLRLPQAAPPPMH
ncbi:CHASE2 and HATPase_c domain-containing protein [Comamonas sp.]|uniref:CHASE2 and HATPase_c domain-containing protein n=1 Tax=Comamonas sp. TaxID=34028 RepID=UPI002590E89A|nr:CHASE2 and HATPase_c domain-containing protein [Comamonas sp.]